MSKPASKKVFSYTTQNIVPALPTIKTAWDLSSLFYTSESDPQLLADIALTEQSIQAFAKKYAKKDFTASPQSLAKALQEYFALQETPGEKALYYLFYRHTLDANDHTAERLIALYSDRLTKANNLVLFFPLKLGKIPKKQQKVLLKAPELQPFAHYLRHIFKTAQHTLSEAEEKILSLKSAPARGLWIAGTDKILKRRTVTYKKKTLGLMEAIELGSSLPNNERPALWRVVVDELKKNAEIAENELNAIITDKKITDELRGYTKPYEAKVESYENDLTSVESLVAAITKKGFTASRKFYTAKAALHGVATLPYVSRYDTIGATPQIPFTEAVTLCRDVFYGLIPVYGEIFDTMLTRGQIDVYPKPRRSGGAFMSAEVGIPTMVFLNQTDDLNSLRTLAHEMGHAIHAERAKAGQPTWYEGHSITTAETASTLFEQLVFDALLAHADDHTKFVLLHDRLTQSIATIQRQIAFFNYEVELHALIRERGAATASEMAELFSKHLQAHLGPNIEVTTDDGYSFVYVGHFRSMFYVYTYAYGLLMSSLMIQNYKADANYLERIDAFLQAGESDTVENIFKRIGIDAHKTETFERALDSHVADVNTFLKLAKKLGKL